MNRLSFYHAIAATFATSGVIPRLSGYCVADRGALLLPKDFQCWKRSVRDGALLELAVRAIGARWLNLAFSKGFVC